MSFDRKKHNERMAEWRERNDNGDCGRVANELIEYIENGLVPALYAGTGWIRTEDHAAALNSVMSYAQEQIVSLATQLASVSFQLNVIQQALRRQ